METSHSTIPLARLPALDRGSERTADIRWRDSSGLQWKASALAGQRIAEGLQNFRGVLVELAEIATQRKAQSGADFIHSQRVQLRDTLPQSVLGHGNGVVEIHGAGSLHAILFTQNHFRWHTTDRGCYGRDRYRR